MIRTGYSHLAQHADRLLCEDEVYCDEGDASKSNGTIVDLSAESDGKICDEADGNDSDCTESSLHPDDDGEPQKEPQEGTECIAWVAKKKHILVSSNAGRPIFFRLLQSCQV